MELDTNFLTLLALIVGVTWWKARDIAADLRARATEELLRAGREKAAEEELLKPPHPLPFVERAAAEARARLHPEIAEQLRAVRAADESFDIERFIAGGCLAYEVIVAAFAEGGREPLRKHLSADVYETFLRAIEAREESGARAELTLIGIKRADIIGADIFGTQIEITLDIESEIVSATRDKKSRVIAGDPARIIAGGGYWTFARDLNAPDPNWKLIATESAAVFPDTSEIEQSTFSDRGSSPGKVPGVGAMRTAAEPHAQL